jgi:predicted O-methyltransferase YrrM
MGKIAETFAKLVVTKSDVQEHLPTLARYASECTHITELGVRTALSTYALLYGKPKSAKLISYDIYSTKEVEELIKIAKEEKSNWEFIIGDTREIDVEETDMIFIDTLHNYDLLKIELERHAPKARKYIIFHDTTTFGES